jgi:hypothetical protein
MVEGLWIVQYEGTQGEGAGVVVFVQGRLLGGDFGYTYEGNYTIQRDWIAASIHVANFLPNIPSVLGYVGDFDLEFQAPIKESVIQGTMSLVGQTGISIAVKLTKKADL